MARAYYQDTFKKVELVVVPKASSSQVPRPSQPSLQMMSISDIDHHLENVEQKAKLVELVETIPLNLDEPEKIVKIETKLTQEERAELLEFLKSNQDVFVWTTNEMLGISVEISVHKLSTDPIKKLVVQKRRLVGPKKQATIDEEIKKLLQAESRKFLGYVVSKKGIEVNPDKVQAVQQMEPPKIVKDVQRLMGRLAALHRFITRVATVEGFGAGAVLIGLDGFKSEHALRFKFQTTNNVAEYEALIYGMKLASELKA
ncbi:hypothetical protein SLEP1_g3100 [Rubroshorea leprosula]|uniref:Uncharacterized protein n=1 Tax=Rubroshorea leprosula TaxID=152421 RepID=A0AAV5HSZ1_9ROSI|nr:hypothetical protein SLEP1_g3100 [Rubroshorea leprosula]